MGIHTVEKKQLSAKAMLRKVRSVFEGISSPPRDSRGRKSKISLADCLMSALAMFSLKFPSLLQFDEASEEKTIRHNLKTLYHVDRAPSDTYMRDRLDEVDTWSCPYKTGPA